MKKIFFDFSKYSGVAIGAAIFDWVVFLLLDRLNTNYIYAQMIARVSGGLFSFLINRSWSFDARQPGHLSVQGRRFIALYIFSYFISIGMLYFIVEIIDMPKYYAKFIADGSSLVLNFVVMRTYVFRDRAGFTATFKKSFNACSDISENGRSKTSRD